MFFFFKQKTAYEMLRSLVGSEMCIRDSGWTAFRMGPWKHGQWNHVGSAFEEPVAKLDRLGACLLYTSDAADDLLCVDLGGRRIIKKKKQHKYEEVTTRNNRSTK